MTPDFLETVPNTAAEIVAAWDKGDSVWSVELGGLGPGYEQAIQVLVVELLRDSPPLPKRGDHAAWTSWGEATVSRIDESCGGFSGAQVGMAKSFAAAVLMKGMRKVLNEVPTDRHIQIGKFWPRAPERA